MEFGFIVTLATLFYQRQGIRHRREPGVRLMRFTIHLSQESQIEWLSIPGSRGLIRLESLANLPEPFFDLSCTSVRFPLVQSGQTRLSAVFLSGCFDD